MRSFVYVLVVAQLLGSDNVWAVERESSTEVAKQHYMKGLDWVEQHDYVNALQEFNAAYDTSPYFAVLYNIAQAQIALDRPLEAATTLSRYLKEGQDRIPPERIDRVKDQISQLEAFLGVLEVSTEPPGALITVDGRAIGRTPLGEAVRLAPGTYAISATLDDGRRVERSAPIRQGTRNHLALQLPPPPPPSPPPPPPPPQPKIDPNGGQIVVQRPPPPPVASGPSRLRVALPYLLAGTGVALAAGALGTYVFWERRAYERWQEARPALQNLQQRQQQDSPDYANAAAELNRRADSVTAAKYTVIGLAIAGGASVAAGAVLYLVDRRSTKASAAPTVSWNGGTSLTLGWRASW